MVGRIVASPLTGTCCILSVCFRFMFYPRPSGSLLTQSIRTSDSLLPATKGQASLHRTRVLPCPALAGGPAPGPASVPGGFIQELSIWSTHPWRWCSCRLLWEARRLCSSLLHCPASCAPIPPSLQQPCWSLITVLILGSTLLGTYNSVLEESQTLFWPRIPQTLAPRCDGVKPSC